MAGLEGLLADLRGVAEGDGEEESGNRKGEDEDVSKAFHRITPGGRLAEGGACRWHVAIGQTTGGAVSQFLEKAEFHLFTEVGIDTGEHIAVKSTSTVPDVSEEEQQCEGGVPKGEPATG